MKMYRDRQQNHTMVRYTSIVQFMKTAGLLGLAVVPVRLFALR